MRLRIHNTAVGVVKTKRPNRVIKEIKKTKFVTTRTLKCHVKSKKFSLPRAMIEKIRFTCDTRSDK
jgi:hypothetical protein